jgi:osmotically inducible protein OsmC
MDRTASAIWHGDLKTGKGTISTQSTTLKDAQYSFKSRFEEGVGTNPEELIAAAHAGCFTMALSAQLTSDNHPPTTLETTAAVTLETTDAGPTVTKIHLTNKSRSGPQYRQVAKFDEIAEKGQGRLPHLAPAGRRRDYAGRPVGLASAASA